MKTTPHTRELTRVLKIVYLYFVYFPIKHRYRVQKIVVYGTVYQL